MLRVLSMSMKTIVLANILKLISFIHFLSCRSKHRKSYLLPHCLSLSKQTMYVTYKKDFNMGKVVTNHDEGKQLIGKQYANVICFPLFGVLKALNVTKVDYFSLDVEGNEMDVLRTIPFDDLDITVELCLFLSRIKRVHAQD